MRLTGKRKLRLSLATLVVPLALLAAGCGGGGGGSNKSGTGGGTAKKGGTITVLSAGDVDNIDPGIAYYSFTYEITYATQRPLYSYKPDSVDPVPDLADGQPQVSSDGKTITVKLKHGIKFSPPVNREVTSADVKYAIERGWATSVTNGYVGAYFGGLVGAPTTTTKTVPNVSGIQTPDKYTIVFKLTKPSGIFKGALGLPDTAPVPQEYANKYDSQTTSTYGQHQVATGPYMIKNDSSGKLTGYQAGRRIELVRNPSWKASTDFRPAYADNVVFKEGFEDGNVTTRDILSGQADVNGDLPPPASQLKSIQSNSSQKDQLVFTPSGGSRYVALNTQKPPFDNKFVRMAVAYVLDRNAMRLTRGGPVDGRIATHFISPDFKGKGWEDSGGYGFNPFPSPNFSGDVNKAKEMMKKAGFSNGMYSGPQVTQVADNAAPGSDTASVVANSLAKIGMHVKTISVTHSTMYTKYCNVPKNEPNICPNVGWLPDFHEPQTLLDPTFNGKNIPTANNSNWPQLNDPAINSAMDKAETILDPTARFKAWGKIDQDVTKTAAAIPWLWENFPSVYSKRVTQASEIWNGGSPDVTFMGIKK